MKKGISLIVSCSLVVAGALFAQSSSPTVEGPKHDGPAKPASTDYTQGGVPGGKINDQEKTTQHVRHHRHKHHTDTSAVNSKGPDASQSPASGAPARSGGAVIPRASTSPTP